MTLDIITHFYRYHEWATDRLLASLEQLTPEEYTAPGCSGNGSIRDTLAHMLSVHSGWFSWFDGAMSVAEAMKPSVTGEDIPTVAEARERWAPIAQQTDAFIGSLTEERANAKVSWAVPNGPSGQTELWKMMLQTANHGTHTRAQIVAAIRRAGHNPGTFELLGFIMSNPE